METAKLCLWAKLIQSCHHDSYTTPPNILLITGTVAVKPKKSKDGVANVVAEAATAIVKAINHQLQVLSGKMERESPRSRLFHFEEAV